jgi:hypothetical protein
MNLSSPSTVSLVSGDAASGSQEATWQRSSGIFLVLLASVWLVLWAVDIAAPLIRPGATIISKAKFDRLVKDAMFQPQDIKRFMLFGNSRTLSGFRPLELDDAFGGGTRSYNLGLPGESRFLPILEAALEAGNVPTHVLLTISWDDAQTPSGILDSLRDDAAIADVLFPFRTFPRDAILFAYNSRLRVFEAVRDAIGERDSMLNQRGWYFIKSQSHFAGDRLPEDYKLPTDQPNRFSAREIPEHSLARDRLERLAIRYQFQILLVPSFARIGEAASPSGHDQKRFADLSTFPRIRSVGPDYWTYPPSNFSDPVHLNPMGASTYTADLVKLLTMHGIGE